MKDDPQVYQTAGDAFDRAMRKMDEADHEDFIALRAECDRLREELRKARGGEEALSNAVYGLITDPESMCRALVAENAGLRGALESAFKVGGDVGRRPVDALLRSLDIMKPALASPSPVTAGVERVLEAVGEWQEARRIWVAAVGTDREGEAKLLHNGTRFALLSAWKHLQALLEGKGESP